MTKVFWSFLFAVVLWGCLKSDNPGQQQCDYTDSQTIAPDSQVQKVKAYLDSNNITAEKHPSGFYYTINSQGNGGTVVNLCSIIIARYKAKFTNGAVFDSTAANSTVNFALGRVIVGWQKAIPLVKGGSELTLYIPPSLAYGPNDVTDNMGNVIIPGNSILIFDIEVLDISG